MVVLLLGAARRMFPLVVAILVVLLFARALGYLAPSETLQVIVFAVGVDLIRRDRVARPAFVAAALGALAAAALLGKLNIGVSVTAMTVVVVLAVSPRRLRGFLVFGGAFVATFLGLWLATGQPLSDLLPYVKGSMEIISGYSDAMARNGPGGRWIYVLFLVAAATLAYLTWRISTGWPWRRRLPLATLLLLFLFAAWKLAFVRDTPTPAFASLAFAAFLLLPARLPRPIVVIVLAAFGLAFLGVSRVPPTTYADVVTSATDFVRQARDDLLPWRWASAEDETRSYLQSHFAVPPEMLAAIAGHSVNIDPVAEGVATAYPGFTWRPQPIFQSYSAYTAYLDQLNADQLRSPARPERILRQVDVPAHPGWAIDPARGRRALLLVRGPRCDDRAPVPLPRGRCGWWLAAARRHGTCVRCAAADLHGDRPTGRVRHGAARPRSRRHRGSQGSRHRPEPHGAAALRPLEGADLASGAGWLRLSTRAGDRPGRARALGPVGGAGFCPIRLRSAHQDDLDQRTRRRRAAYL